MSGSRIRLYGSTSGYVELEAPAVADDGVLVLPTAADGFGAAGIGSNVVQTVKTDGFTTTSTSRVTVTGTTVTITPSSNTSKILVVATGIASSESAGSNPRIYLVRGVTEIANSTGATYNQTTTVYQSAANYPTGFAITFLDSPATTSPTTYEIGLSTTTAGTARIGIANATPTHGAQTVITAIEVAA